MKKASSPWKNTRVIDKLYLDILNIRSIPYEDDDVLYTVTPIYTHRPDLLANDLYGDPGLWWVFAQRNMDIIQDPIYDLVAGIEIRLPKGHNLSKLLG
jgi:hypothetical protein